MHVFTTTAALIKADWNGPAEAQNMRRLVIEPSGHLPMTASPLVAVNFKALAWQTNSTRTNSK